ncbi:hemolysin family protein [Bacillus solimangrovi]|uniref:Transporter associated domain protein n=1 Tax=Bacillus solimangrovi TaxID=1305675 RepID=A0A1E5LIJ9_9BACI|nr:hemolysin family protein [Bacillus solimangrovi]OEH93891.1 hypothetical protein BFG57_10485 [Bacillus solimangrovi]
MALLNLFLIALLIALTAFFVASEFAIVKVRMTKIEHLAASGNKSAQAAMKVLNHLDEYLSACQLGITITSLGLGWLGEPTVEKLLHPVLQSFEVNETISSVVSFTIAFSAITFLHVVVGELAPKTVAIQKSEKISLLVAQPLIYFYKVMYPFIWLLNGSAQIITRLFGLHPASDHEMAHSEEELRLILSESYKSGEINQTEYQYVDKIFEFDERLAREIMIPRTEMVVVDEQDLIEENLKRMIKERYTRYPVVDGDKDHVTGIINVRDLLIDLIDNKRPESLTAYIRPVIHVIETIPVRDLLMKMQLKHIHMAILIDEYGGTAGLVTVEDILEEIVGDIRDEFDVDEQPDIQRVSEGTYIVDGKVLIDDLNKVIGTSLNHSNIDTVGGWLLSEKIEVKEEEEIEYDGVIFKVLEMDGRHISSVQVTLSNLE